MELRKPNPKSIGELTEAMVLAALLRAGKTVLKPFGDNQRYDLVVDEEGKFQRIQCKTGRLKNGVIFFSTRSVAGGKKIYIRTYVGQIEFFGIYCPETDKCYLVPITECGINNTSIRVETGKNPRHKRSRNAKDFEIMQIPCDKIRLRGGLESGSSVVS